MNKILILGLPRCGKTTLGKQLQQDALGRGESMPVTHTDDIVREYEWSVFSDKVCDMLKQPGPWVIEGCSAVRGLRKYLKEANKLDSGLPKELPFTVMWLDKPYIALVGRQIGFAASLKSVWGECEKMREEKV